MYIKCFWLSICINESALLVLISPCLGLLMGNAYDEIRSQCNNKVIWRPSLYYVVLSLVFNSDAGIRALISS